MRFLRDFVTKMLIVQVVGVAGMLLAGWILTIIQRDTYCPQQNFFTYPFSVRSSAWITRWRSSLAGRGMDVVRHGRNAQKWYEPTDLQRVLSRNIT